MKLSRKVCDVASAYFPAPQKASSTRRLRRWIDSDPTLARALVRAGYRKGQHAFTPRQFKVLRRILARRNGGGAHPAPLPFLLNNRPFIARGP